MLLRPCCPGGRQGMRQVSRSSAKPWADQESASAYASWGDTLLSCWGAQCVPACTLQGTGCRAGCRCHGSRAQAWTQDSTGLGPRAGPASALLPPGMCVGRA